MADFGGSDVSRDTPEPAPVCCAGVLLPCVERRPGPAAPVVTLALPGLAPPTTAAAAPIVTLALPGLAGVGGGGVLTRLVVGALEVAVAGVGAGVSALEVVLAGVGGLDATEEDEEDEEDEEEDEEDEEDVVGEGADSKSTSADDSILSDPFS